MLQPKKTKFRKAFKGRIKGDAKGGTDLNFGSYGLKAMEPDRITARQIEAARRAITRHIKRQGRLWIRIFPEQFNLRFQAATNQLERPARIQEVRRDIARIKTLRTERQNAGKPVVA